MTVREALSEASAQLVSAGVDAPRLEARLLLAWTLKVRREDLVCAPERELSEREALIFRKATSLRALRRPLPYITGEQWFYGRAFKINRAVLIPRPETEGLVEAALAACRGIASPRFADIGTGSGCIAVTLACEIPHAHILATDISPDALTLAGKNARRHGVAHRITFAQGDMAQALPPDLRYEAIVSNPPYITEEELLDLQPEVRDYEPTLALSGLPGATGARGDLLHRRLLEEARALLAPEGHVLLEVGQGQAAAVVEYARALGYDQVEAVPDLAGIDRVVRARWS